MNLTRRTVLGMAGSVPLALWAGCRVRLAPGRRIPIAVQLYSVRRDCAQNFDAALQQVAAMGFVGVEFAGYYGYANKAAALAARLKALNLKVAGTHLRMPDLRGDALKATIDFHKTIGCRFLLVPGDAAFTDPEKSKALADEFNKLAQTLKPLGMACGFHNHTGEFKKDGEKTYWDLFAERTTKDVILQQDCGWTLAAGFDPVAYVRKYPGRTRTAHFKPTVVPAGATAARAAGAAAGAAHTAGAPKRAILGQDSVDWKGVYAACREVGGTEWIVVEQETYPDNKPPMDCTRESLAGLLALLK